MKNKHFFISAIVGLIIFIFIVIVYNPLDEKVEEMYKLNFYFSFIGPLMAVVLKYMFRLFKSKGMKMFAYYLFVLLFSSGLGMIIKSGFLGELSYIGLTNIVISIMALILSGDFIKVRLVVFK
jgi:hypothetical protein